MKKRSVALSLSGGGARGVAHIGAIEELERQGYEITAVSGTSMGALVGGVYVSGHLEAFREWMCELDRYRVFGLVDFSLSAEGLVKGERVIREMQRLVPDVRIEELSRPFTAVAADVLTGREVVISRGGLFGAIRASISIPSVFRPVHRDGMVLIDGGTVNPLPVNRVQRREGDLLVAVDVCAPFASDPAARAHVSLNYYKMLVSSSQIMQQHITQLMCRLCPPDVLVELPADSYGMFEFYRAGELVEAGRRAMREALERFAQGLPAPDGAEAPAGRQ